MTMKIVLTYLKLTLFTLASITADASDRETRDLRDFSGVSVSAGVDATLVKGDHNEITITVDGIELDRVRTDIKGDVLEVSVKQKRWWFGSWKKKDIDVVITYNGDLEELRASSGSQLHAEQTITADNLDIKVSSGASINIEINTDHLNLDMSSGSTAQLTGIADAAYVGTSSGATLKAYSLKTDKADIDSSSGSTVKISVVNDLVVDVSSGAGISYKGNPINRDIDKSSGGSVRQTSGVVQ